MLKKPDTETLTDGRLRLRRLDLTDADTITAGVHASMAALSAWMPWAHPGYSRTDGRWFVANAWLGWHNGTAYEFVVESADDGRFLGMCGLNGVSADGRANLGYWVMGAEAGQGICTDAARLVARFGFRKLGLSRIRLFHAVGNHGSRRVAEKVGFAFEGLRRKHLLLGGTRHDTRLYSLVSIDEITSITPG